MHYVIIITAIIITIIIIIIPRTFLNFQIYNVEANENA